MTARTEMAGCSENPQRIPNVVFGKMLTKFYFGDCHPTLSDGMLILSFGVSSGHKKANSEAGILRGDFIYWDVNSRRKERLI